MYFCDNETADPFTGIDSSFSKQTTANDAVQIDLSNGDHPRLSDEIERLNEDQEQTQISCPVTPSSTLSDNICNTEPLVVISESSEPLISGLTRVDDDWYTYQPLETSECPFKNLHHSGLPTEFLSYPLCRVSDKRSQHILAEMNNPSTGVSVKVQFIVNNLKNCLGIWPQLFLQKLNTILVHADQGTVRAVLSKDNFAVLRDLSCYYAKETKCCMVFRYWCFMYIAFSRNLTPVVPVSVKDQLVAQLQIDFSLAAQDSCRCKLDTRCVCLCEPDDEHRKIGSLQQMQITGVLLYFLVCKIGVYSTNVADVYEGTSLHLNLNKFAKGTLVSLYLKLYEKTKVQTEENSTEHNLMELIAHLLVAFNAVSSSNSSVRSTAQLLLDMGYLSSAEILKGSLLNILERESDIILNGPSPWLRLVFNVPTLRVSFTTLGLPAVTKSLNDFISGIEYGILSRDQQVHVMDLIVRLQIHLGQTGLWSSEYENIYLHCRQLQCTLERAMGYHLSDVKLEPSDPNEGIAVLGSRILPSISLPLNSSESENESGDSSQTSQSRLHVSKAHDNEEWVADAKSIARMRKGYESEIKSVKMTFLRRLGRCILRALEGIVICRKSRQ